jgi:hypothetical protein
MNNEIVLHKPDISAIASQIVDADDRSGKFNQKSSNYDEDPGKFRSNMPIIDPFPSCFVAIV